MFVLIAFGAVAAQEYTDVVCLKNGSVIRGVIVELVPDSIVRIETVDRGTMVLPFSDVATMIKEKRPAPAPVTLAVPAANGAADVSMKNYMAITALLSDIKANGAAISALGKGLTPEHKKMLIAQMRSKNSAAVPFLVNALLGCGIGSLIQGNYLSGIVQFVIEGTGIVLLVMSQTYDAACVSYGICLAGYVPGLFTPWTCSEKRNNAFNKLLAASPSENDRSAGMERNALSGGKPAARFTLPILAIRF